MSKFLPYRIVHLDLAELEKYLDIIHQLQSPAYFVIWWREIPLGHFYFERMEEKNELRGLIYKNIQPTLDSYSQDQMAIVNIQKAILSSDVNSLEYNMRTILGNLLPRDIPDYADISIIICTRNRSNILIKCLDSLAKQHCKPREIIIVDNAPSDDSTERLVNLTGDIRYIREERPGLDIARNTGAINAGNNIIAYLDDDVVIDPFWTYRIMEAFLDNTVDAITGLVLPASLEAESQVIFEKFWSFNKGYLQKKYTSGFLKPKDKDCPKVWNIGAGANMAFRKDILEKVNYFDERLDAGAAGCSGDSEIWFRILRIRGNILYSPLAIVYHEHRRDMKGLERQLFNYMKGNVTAALIQHQSEPALNYARHVFRGMTRNYLLLLLGKFRNPGLRHKTIIKEALGALSGVIYFSLNRKRKPLT
ncbi:glycosyltransferase family 2 protein [Flavihumibacter sp. ZG627]|uniref:glycosyltransferase family 2 protein n=1 Tax=Flavihumibacter sp. ZG627 TaxID=1463156 RepID=UPI00057E5D7D|nr:glycosyltransferase family 2 protein [Flavihumibacter sp. ZG627]KIC92326.1 hypothetical protein HY58_01960 [Flavihumibacter sp. ZG627]